jgi:hypothetical protein
MCLNSVTNRKHQDIVGYKMLAYSEVSDAWLFPCYSDGYRIMIGDRLRRPGSGTLSTGWTNGSTYANGYHVFRSKQAARDWCDEAGDVVVKVTGKAHTFGKQTVFKGHGGRSRETWVCSEVTITELVYTRKVSR